MSTLKIDRLTKQLAKADAALVLAKLNHDDEMTRLNENWQMKYTLIIKLFQAALDDAGTIGEARKWFTEWTKDINSLDDNSDIQALFDKHGFEFETMAETHYKDML